MKVFISWSGKISHKVAIVLRDWLPSVIQLLEPYVSSEDIDKGARGLADISEELEHSSFGLLCVTKDNIHAPWLNFEAGALSRSVEKGRVAPFLFDVEVSEITESPLLQFQATTFDKADIKRLVHSLNKAGGDTLLLREDLLNDAFDTLWSRLEARLNEIKVSEPEAKKDTDTSLQTVQQIEEVKDLVKEMKKELLEKLNAQLASQNPDEATRTVASVQRDPAASWIDRAIVNAILLQQQGKIEESVEKWRSIANVAEGEDRQLQARAWFSVGYLRSVGEGIDLEAAIDAYTRAIELNPGFTEAYSNRGNAKDERGQHEAALADYDRAIELNPGFAEAYSNRGSTKNHLRQHEAAIADYDRAIELNPDSAEAYSNRGNAKDDLGQHEAAIADHDRAIELNPDEPARVYYNRGNAKKNLGQHEAALADYDQTIELNPDYVGAYINRGATKVGLGQHEAALADFGRAIELDPDDIRAYNNRAAVHVSLSHVNEAREDFQKALALAQAAGDEALITAVKQNLSRLDDNK